MKKLPTCNLFIFGEIGILKKCPFNFATLFHKIRWLVSSGIDTDAIQHVLIHLVSSSAH
jgi:hypothetical protein